MLHQIGAGVLGPVFLARDADRRSFAIKVFRLDITPEQAAELASQLGALSRVNLEHPSIAAPVTAGVEGTVAYLVQEYVGADSLDAAIRQYGPAPIGQALKILTNVAAALDFAGAVNVHHGALHPRDLLVTPEQTRITGLGIAAALETIGLRAPIRRPYTAPERVQREAWDGRADVFSLGVLARELILGRGQRTEGEARLSDALAARMQDIVARATEARPSERFATALDVVRDLQEALAGGQPASAKPAPPRSLRVPRGRGLLLPLDGEPSSPETPAEAAEAGAPPPAQASPSRAPEPVPETSHAILDATTQSIPDIDVRRGRAGQEEISDLPLNADAVAERQAIDEAPRIEEATPVVAPAEQERYIDVFEDQEPSAAPEPVPEPERLAVPDREPVRSFGAATLDAPLAAEPADTTFRRPAHPAVEEPPVAHRTGLLPFAAVLIVGLIIGAIGGYFWGVNSAEIPVTPRVSDQQPGVQPTAAAEPQASTPSSSQAAIPPAVSAAGKRGGPLTAAPAAAKPPATKPAPVAPAPANVKGRLVVRSTPSGAVVTINGRRRGVTPLRLANLSAGRYTVRLTRSGYAPEERDVVISGDRPSSTLTLTLSRGAAPEPAGRAAFVGTLAVDSTPPGAKVFLDGKLVGTTPCTVPDVAVGSHVVRVDMIGFRRWAQSVQVKSAARVRVTAALERESQ